MCSGHNNMDIEFYFLDFFSIIFLMKRYQLKSSGDLFQPNFL